jgi:hypothetical protein
MNIEKKDQKPNEVDKLKAKIKKIQKFCKHDWRLVKKPELLESLVPGVFIGDKVASSSMSLICQKEISLKCKKCSKKLVASITSICPRCFGLMYKGDLYTLENDGTSSRKKYFGEDLAYHGIRIYHCRDCGLAIASDEWNQ